MKLYETYIQIEQLWETVEGILTGDITEGPDGLPVNPDMALDWLEDALRKVEDERDTKALNIACLVKNFRAEADALKAEKTRLAKRQQAAERTIDRLTTYPDQLHRTGPQAERRPRSDWLAKVGVGDPVSQPRRSARGIRADQARG